LHPFARQTHRDAFTDARARARDQGGFVVELQVQVVSFIDKFTIKLIANY
jgi:hypothetical protein